MDGATVSVALSQMADVSMQVAGLTSLGSSSG